MHFITFSGCDGLKVSSSPSIIDQKFYPVDTFKKSLFCVFDSFTNRMKKLIKNWVKTITFSIEDNFIKNIFDI